MNRALLALLLCLATSGPALAQSNQPYIAYESIHHPVQGRYGMVVSQNHFASWVGRKILQEGGNAVDAAVAMGFALAVTLPRAGNLGGSGFMLVHLAGEGKTIALDYRSVAPKAATEAVYRDGDGDVDWDALTVGARASAVPGTVAGLFEAWQRFGSLPWKQLLQPAYDLAAKGFNVSHDLNYALSEGGPVLAKFPASAAIYIRPDGYAWQTGQKLVQLDLAWSIGQIMESGAEAFYKGELAKRIAAAFAADGGLIRMADLAAYEVKEREPVATDYRAYRVVSMPLVSAGGVTLIQMLNMLEQFPVGESGAGSAKNLHLLAEVMKRAAANRRTHLGDPDFMKVPVEGYISKALGKKMAGDIDLEKAADVSKIDPEPVHQYESRDTTHFSVMDAEGNAVSNTYTLGYSFGSGWVAAGTGILFDNQMRNYSFRDDETHPNALAPGKRVLSTMTPTIVLDEAGKVYLVTGTPGGSQIINVVLQILVNVIDHGMGIAEATHQPRIHQGWRVQRLGVEPGISPDTLRILESMGHEVAVERAMGSTQSIQWRDGRFYGAADPRRPNATALGLVFPPQAKLRQAE